MIESILQWFRKVYNKAINSIAFFPALIALGFLVLSILMMEMDERGVGLQVNESIKWLRLRDVETARTIVATVAAGVISLTVFNFSIFMVVLNQAASQMSNRMLDNMIGDRFQKLILGSYIGTMVYALFLLASINENSNNNFIPSLSIYLLLLFTVFDIFLFILFLHYVTEAFRYEQLIQRIHTKTIHSLQHFQATAKDRTSGAEWKKGFEVSAPVSGYFQHFSTDQLLDLTTTQDITVRFLYPTGYYVLQGTPFLEIGSNKPLSDTCLKKLFLAIDFYHGQHINKNPYYGFQHLMEVGVKALSPGINDPITAVMSLHALTDLLMIKLKSPVPTVITDKQGKPRIFTIERSLKEIFENSFIPIWHYGKNDPHIQKAFSEMIRQLQLIDKENKLSFVLLPLQEEIESVQRKASKAF